MSAPLTLTQHTVLAHLSDGEWRLGSDLTRSANVLEHLSRRGYIRRDFDTTGYLFSNWTVTPAGLAALEAVA